MISVYTSVNVIRVCESCHSTPRGAYSTGSILVLGNYCTHCHLCTTEYSFTHVCSETLEQSIRSEPLYFVWEHLQKKISVYYGKIRPCNHSRAWTLSYTFSSLTYRVLIYTWVKWHTWAWSERLEERNMILLWKPASSADWAHTADSGWCKAPRSDHCATSQHQSRL